MAQETVERILGRLFTDARFRRRFFAESRYHLRQYDLLDYERESLAGLAKLEPQEVEPLVELLSEWLDPRIVRG